MSKILYISGSIGLGHIGRDLAIVKALRKINANVDISWLAEDPAGMVVKQAGEKLLIESSFLGKGNSLLEKNASNYQTNLVKWLMKMRKDWASNATLVKDLVEKEGYDLVIGDETYELLIAMVGDKNFKKFPFVMIYDMLGIDNVTSSLVDNVAAYMVNRMWVKALKSGKDVADLNLFVGENEDIPDRRFGFMLPNRRQLGAEVLEFTGYILPFDPSEYQDKAKVRSLLGYGREPLIVCSVGGTSAGKELLELCSKAYPLLKEHLPGLRMILVCGPNLSPDSIKVSEGLEVQGYVPNLFMHLAAADLAIVTGGGTVTLELMSMHKPFLYFPLKHHFEQEVDVAYRCQRHGAGIRMDFDKTTPELLEKTALESINNGANYLSISTDGATKSAELINEILMKNNQKTWSSGI